MVLKGWCLASGAVSHRPVCRNTEDVSILSGFRFDAAQCRMYRWEGTHPQSVPWTSPPPHETCSGHHPPDGWPASTLCAPAIAIVAPPPGFHRHSTDHRLGGVHPGGPPQSGKMTIRTNGGRLVGGVRSSLRLRSGPVGTEIGASIGLRV